jgi:translation initiation factor IF-2
MTPDKTVTVESLAKLVHISVDRLLSYLKASGTPKEKARDIISDQEKRKLLIYLSTNKKLLELPPPKRSWSKPKTDRTSKLPDTTGLSSAPKILRQHPLSVATQTVAKSHHNVVSTVATSPSVVTVKPVVKSPLLPDRKRKHKISKESHEPKRFHQKNNSFYKKDDDSLAHLFGGNKDTAAIMIRRPVTAGVLSQSLQKKFKKPVKRLKTITLSVPVTFTQLAHKLGIRQTVMMAPAKRLNIDPSQWLDVETATILAKTLGYAVTLQTQSLDHQLLALLPPPAQPVYVARAPVIAIMGHVDHGKTSLLAHIRQTKTTEIGDITQALGSYDVCLPNGRLTFLDTPGHAAFTAMRARGAHFTDIAVLVVSAEDGVKAQTIEAIQHIHAAHVAMVVAITKIDMIKSTKSIETLYASLSEHHVLVEPWGGPIQVVSVSSKTGEGISDLLDALYLQAELLELTAMDNAHGKAWVIESYLDPQKGPIAMLLVQEGCLKVTDHFVVHHATTGKIKGLFKGKEVVKKATILETVCMLGANELLPIGAILYVTPNDKVSKAILALTPSLKEHPEAKPIPDDPFAILKADKKIGIKCFIKAGSAGALEAITALLKTIEACQIIGTGVGPLTLSDVLLASTTDALVVLYQTDVSHTTQPILRTKNITILEHTLIYAAVAAVQQYVNSLQAPVRIETLLGSALVRAAFQAGTGLAAGCMITEGMVKRGVHVKIKRKEKILYTGTVHTIRRFKEPVTEVKAGYECGIVITHYKDIVAGDCLEFYQWTESSPSLA